MRKHCPRCGEGYGADATFCPADGSRLVDRKALDPYIGTIIANDILLTDAIGGGASGNVYRGRQRSVDRDVAVKVLRRELGADPTAVRRFEREAAIASRLCNDHVVDVYLTGRLPDGTLFIVMEYVEGRSLADELREAGALPLDRAYAIALQLCDAVGAAHAHGIVHRDIKPENVMITAKPDGAPCVKLLDFGIAKASLDGRSMHTEAGRVFGSAHTISPEAAVGAKSVGPASDVYSLGTVIYEMLAGRPPFEASCAVALLVRHINDEPPHLRSVAADRGIPDGVASVVMQCLAKEPTLRPCDGRALGDALRAAMRAPGPIDATLVDRAPSRPSTLGGTVESTLPAPRPPRPGLRAVLALAVALGALAPAAYVARRKAEHTAVVAHARAALVDGRYTSPPGDNVREIAAAGLAKWPTDAALTQVRIDAARELVTEALAAHSAGDVRGARDDARDALEVVPGDFAAKALADQYGDELQLLSAPNAKWAGAPRILVDAPEHVRAPASIDVAARVAGRSARDAGRSATASLAALDGDAVIPTDLRVNDDGSFRVHAAAPTSGRYRLVVETIVDGRLLRAERVIDVDGA